MEAGYFGPTVAAVGLATLRVYGMELSIRGSARESFAAGPGPVNSFYGFEFGRTYLLSRQGYGRLNAEVFYSDVQSTWYAKIALSTGFLSRADSPWAFHFTVDYALAYDRSREYVGVGLHFLHDAVRWKEDSTLQTGMFVRWRQRSRVATPMPGPDDWMLFSLGPSLQWNPSALGVTVNVPFRVWLDNEPLPDGTEAKPQEFSWPALEVSAHASF